MVSRCEVTGCDGGTELFCFGCRKWFCKKHYSEHREIVRQIQVKAIFPAGNNILSFNNSQTPTGADMIDIEATLVGLTYKTARLSLTNHRARR